MGRVTRILQASTQQSERVPQRPDARPPVSDPDLARVLALWPTLPKHIKRAILTLISASVIRPE